MGTAFKVREASAPVRFGCFSFISHGQPLLSRYPVAGPAHTGRPSDDVHGSGRQGAPLRDQNGGEQASWPDRGLFGKDHRRRTQRGAFPVASTSSKRPDPPRAPPSRCTGTPAGQCPGHGRPIARVCPGCDRRQILRACAAAARTPLRFRPVVSAHRAVSFAVPLAAPYPHRSKPSSTSRTGRSSLRCTWPRLRCSWPCSTPTFCRSCACTCGAAVPT